MAFGYYRRSRSIRRRRPYRRIRRSSARMGRIRRYLALRRARRRYGTRLRRIGYRM